MSVLPPPKMYLDTNHLIGIAKARTSVSHSAYSFIDDLLRKRHFGIIFNPAAPLEWVDGNATIESAQEIAAVIDSAPLQYEFEKDSFVFLHEIQVELRRIQPGIRLPEFEVLLLRDVKKATARALPILRNDVPGFFGEGELLHDDAEWPNEVGFSTAAEHVECAFRLKNERPAVYRERVEGHKAAYEHDLKSFAAARHGARLPRPDVLGWMKRFVRVDRVVAALNPRIAVDELLGRVDLTRCPAVNLSWKTHMKRIRAGQSVDDNDTDDWMFVPVVPYADLVLTERNLAHYIRQADAGLGAKVTHDPQKAIEILKPWLRA